MVPGLEIKDADRESKGKGGQLSELFDTDAQLDKFLEIWTWFRDAAHPREPSPPSRIGPSASEW